MTGAVQTARWLVVRDDGTLRAALAEAAGWGMPGGAHSNPWVVADFVLEVLRDVGTPATTAQERIAAALALLADFEPWDGEVAELVADLRRALTGDSS